MRSSRPCPTCAQKVSCCAYSGGASGSCTTMWSWLSGRPAGPVESPHASNVSVVSPKNSGRIVSLSQAQVEWSANARAGPACRGGIALPAPACLARGKPAALIRVTLGFPVPLGDFHIRFSFPFPHVPLEQPLQPRARDSQSARRLRAVTSRGFEHGACRGAHEVGQARGEGDLERRCGLERPPLELRHVA